MTGTEPERPYVNPLVEALVPDPVEPRDLTMIRGYVGPSDEVGFVRIYLDPTMSTWFDIPEKHVIHHRHVDSYGGNPLGEDVLWMSSRMYRRLDVESTTEGVTPGLKLDATRTPPGPAHDSGPGHEPGPGRTAGGYWRFSPWP